MLIHITTSVWYLLSRYGNLSIFFTHSVPLSRPLLVEVKKANKWKWENFWTCFILDSTTLVAKHMLSRCHRLNGQFLFWCICVKQTRNVSMNFRIPLSVTKLWIRGTEKPEIQLNAKKWKICSNETRSKISHLWWWWWCSSSTWWWGSRGELVLKKKRIKVLGMGFHSIPFNALQLFVWGWYGEILQISQLEHEPFFEQFSSNFPIQIRPMDEVTLEKSHCEFFIKYEKWNQPTKRPYFVLKYNIFLSLFWVWYM